MTMNKNLIKMKTIFTLLLLAGSLTALAQDEQSPYEGTPLQAYLEFCLYQREAMTKKSTEQLRECIEESTESDFRFNDVAIRLYDFTNDIEAVETTKGVKVDTYYTPDYVDELLMHDTDYRDAELEGPALMRDTEIANCMYAHQALAGGASGTWRIHCEGKTRLVCVPSPNGLVSVEITSESGVNQPFTLEDKATKDSPYTDCAWEMDEQGTVLVKVTNLSNKNVSFVLATE